MNRSFRWVYFLILGFDCCTSGTTHQTDQPLFTLMTDEACGISFLNEIREDDSLNVLTYEYLYNGAGLGIADFNQDGLNDVFFSGNTGPDKLFLNEGHFHFTDVTATAGVQGKGTWSTGVSIADVNGDGLPDIYVCHSGKYTDPDKLTNELFINQGVQNGVPRFREMAKDYGLDAPGTLSTQAVFFDYDHDGDLDMFLLNHSNHSYNPFQNTRKTRSTPSPYFGNRLFRQDRDAKGRVHFTDVTLPAGIVSNPLNFGLSVTVSDVNGDGWPDIYTTSDYSERDCFYINNRNGTFTESLEKSFAHISKYAMGSDIADYNNDGRPDLVTLDMLPEGNHRQKLLKGPDHYDQYHQLLDSGYYNQQMRNMLQLNQGVDETGTVRFSEIGQLAGISNTDWSWAALFADFDNDGWKDLFVSNGYLRDYTDMDFLKYTVADAKFEAARQGHQRFQTYDLVKRMPSNKLSCYLFHNNHDLSFSNVAKAWGLDKPGISNASAYADLDNDGDLDLIVCNNNEPARIYRNNENELRRNHFLRIRLTGTGMNTAAFGAKAMLTTSDGLNQYQELYPVRGYQSSVAPEFFFGFPGDLSIKQFMIRWPDGRETVLKNVRPGQVMNLKQADAVAATDTVQQKGGERIFKDVTRESGIDFRHRENDFVDFKDEVLLPYQLSREGPALAKADVNGDQLEDVFVGGAIGQGGRLYLQTSAGKFEPAAVQPWIADSNSEDVNALFFDADGDGDPDLYVVSGGNEYTDQSPEYEDRLYLNDGKGHFSRASNALPPMLSSKLAIAAGDFDHDGDLDLFIGGRGLPGSFPLPSRSYLLRNDSKDGVVRFTDVTNEVNSSLIEPGMVTAAVWADLDGDQYPELLIAGDWMPVKLFENEGGKLADISAQSGLTGLNGMWSFITVADLNNDGKTDFILGNCGYNNQFKASPEQPLSMYAADFDDNGAIDPIICYNIGNKSYPMASRDELLDQVNSLKKKFARYEDYADATLADIFPAEKIQQAKYFYCDQLASGILYNDGHNHFSFQPFSLPGQFSKSFAAVADDFDGDGRTDILLSGNFYPYRTELGTADASLGVLYRGTGHSFEAVGPAKNGAYIGGDVRGMVEVKDGKGNKFIVVARNNDSIQVLKAGR